MSITVGTRTITAWAVPAAAVATGFAVEAGWLIALGIGLAAGVSLSGSV